MKYKKLETLDDLYTRIVCEKAISKGNANEYNYQEKLGEFSAFTVCEIWVIELMNNIKGDKNV